MTVKELIAALTTYNPDAQVIVVTQAHWPIEHALAGLASRAEITAAEADEDPEGQPDEPPTDESGADEVVLVEGAHLGYGSRAAWHAARRP